MTRPEMIRRLQSIPTEERVRVHRAVVEGWGANGITHEFHVNLKQANAVFEWFERYGNISPRNV